MNTFVYIVKNYRIDDKTTILQREVGIRYEKGESTSIVQFVNYKEDLAEIPNILLREFNPYETGDGFEYKVCNRCNRLLPVDCFQKNQNGKNNRAVRRPSCNDCREIIDGKEMSSSDKAKWTKTKPHMEIWECPICKKRTIPGLTSKVVLDHNHETGKPNGWICDSCNTGLGRFKDDTDVMEEAIKYLKEHQK